MSSGMIILTVIFSLMTLPLVESQAVEFNSTLPRNILYCETLSAPSMFNVTCQYNVTNPPSWIVRNLEGMAEDTIVDPSTLMGNFVPRSSTGFSILTVNSQDIRNGTCFQCRITTLDGIFPSAMGCVSAVGTQCISEIHVQSQTDTSITFTWTLPAPGLSYHILVCPENTSRCFPRVTCIDCSSYNATGLSPNTNYTVTVDSFSLMSSGECVSKGCTSNTATAQTDCICAAPSNIWGQRNENLSGIIAGVAVGCFALYLPVTAASVVITFLCTRRCYKKSSSSPKEKSVYYETVHSDSVQMQPSPAYETVDKI